MLVLSGADLVLPDRIVTGGSLIIDRGRIEAVESGRSDPAGATVVDARGQYVVPGFIDVHVHGVLGRDTLDGGDAIGAMAQMMPRFGTTAFCPTTVACPPDALRAMLAAVRQARLAPPPNAARVLPAHLESNFINPEYRGAQPLECLRTFAGTADTADYSGRDLIDLFDACRPDIGIVTVAPEMPGGMELVAKLVADGHFVSIGHSGATFEQAIDALDAGATQATHLFNRMTPMSHRSPGVAGAVLSRQDVCVELVCDAYHVHPAVCRVAIAGKGRSGVMAITDGTAGSGLPVGHTARQGGRTLTVRPEAAFLDDGTLAGSTVTMDRVFRTIVTQFGLSVVDAAHLCATTPARALGLTGHGVLAAGAVADLAVLDGSFAVVRTLVAGAEVFAREP